MSGCEMPLTIGSSPEPPPAPPSQPLSVKVVRMREAGTAVLLVEQNARRALQTADIGCVLDLGTVHIAGPAPELLADPQLSELYLGGGPAEPQPAAKR